MQLLTDGALAQVTSCGGFGACTALRSADDVCEDVQHARAGGQLLLLETVARGGFLRSLLLDQRLRKQVVPGHGRRVMAVPVVSYDAGALRVKSVERCSGD